MIAFQQIDELKLLQGLFGEVIRILWFRREPMTTSMIPAGADSTSRRQRGFTLIELMIVIAIMTTLTGVILPAVQRLRDTQHQAGVGNSSFGSAPPLSEDVGTEIDALADQSNPGSTQSLAWRLVMAATNADPASGGLDQVALNELYQNLQDREASIQDLTARVDDLLATHPSPGERRLLLAERDGLVQALDGVRKMKAVIQSRVTAAAAP